MKHTFWLLPNRLAGRPGPAHAPWALTELRAAGFGAVLNVSEFEPAWSAFADVGLDVAWVPLPNHYPATAETEEVCREQLPRAYQFIQRHLAMKRAILVHCAWGRDRTGLVLADYLVRVAKLSPTEAIAQVRQVCPQAITAIGWADMAVRICIPSFHTTTANAENNK